MAESTGISWCDSTFNGWMGCTKVGPGCDHCYAEVSTPARTLDIVWGPHAERRRTSPANWRQPLKWEREHDVFQAEHGRRRRVFCSSLSDVFDNQVPASWRADLFALIEATPHLDWLLLTKRIGNVPAMMRDVAASLFWMERLDGGELPPNVWIGATVVNQDEANRDVPKLLKIPARVRFLSVEPMLERIYIEDIPDPAGGECLKPLAGLRWIRGSNGRCETYPLGHRIDWVICGGESGPHARPMHPDWARSLRDQCQAAGVPVFFKQWGEWIPGDQRECPTGSPISRWMWMDGTPFAHGQGDRGMPIMCRLGKAATGCLLDGVEHKAWPAPV